MAAKKFITKNWLSFVVVIVVAIFAIYFATNHTKNNSLSPDNTKTILSSANPPISTINLPPVPALPVYSGVLQLSDDLRKGNLKLLTAPDSRLNNGLTKPTALYIQTQRDFSALINHRVIAEFIGDSNDFRLVRIVPDDGKSTDPMFSK